MLRKAIVNLINLLYDWCAKNPIMNVKNAMRIIWLYKFCPNGIYRAVFTNLGKRIEHGDKYHCEDASGTHNWTPVLVQCVSKRVSSFFLKRLDLQGFFYLMVDAVLIVLYCIIWVICWRKNNVFKAMALSIIPSAIFLFSGIMCRSILLIISPLLFAPAHIFISYKGVHKEGISQKRYCNCDFQLLA